MRSRLQQLCNLSLECFEHQRLHTSLFSQEAEVLRVASLQEARVRDSESGFQRLQV
jgi:hypothetical protein